MKNIKWILLVAVVILGGFGINAYYNLDSKKSSTEWISNGGETISPTPQPPLVAKADKIELLHFHTTQQCWSCTTIGKYSEKIAQTIFKKEFDAGIITYQDINIDEEKNKELADKFKVTGSALYINAIKDGKDYYENNTQVWQLVSSENAFTQYLEGRIKSML